MAKKPRLSAQDTLRRRIEILAFLKVSGDKSFGEINNVFKYKNGCLLTYLNSLRATGNIERILKSGTTNTYRFIKFY